MYRNGISRRDFLKAGTAAVTSATLVSQLGSLDSFASVGDRTMEEVQRGERRVVPSHCGMCVNNCAILCEVVDGKLHKINPNKKHISSRGMLCAKGNAGAALPYSPERLKTPLLRTGERGEGKWKEISWDEAYKMIAEKLAEFKEKYENRSSVAFASTSGGHETYFNYLAQAFGSTNTIRHPSLCLTTTVQGWFTVFGNYPDADFTNAHFVILLGADRAQAFMTPDSVDFQNNRPKGQKIIYLDPRFTVTAAKADKWYPVKPATDMAFILGMIHEILEKEMYDSEFIERYTHGFEELRDFVFREGYTPELAESRCEIPASEIRWCAEQFAFHAPRSLVYPGRRSAKYWNEVYFRRACAALTALCGCWDVPGGMIPKASISLNSPDPMFPFFEQAEERIDKVTENAVQNLLPTEDECGAVGQGLPYDYIAYLDPRDGSWPVFREAILNDDPYKVRGLFVFRQNPVQAIPNVQKTLRMLNKMEFICVIEQQMSDTAWYADLVLPSSTYLEAWDSCNVYDGIWPSVACRQEVIKPLFNSKTMFEICGGIIKEMLQIPSLWDDADEWGVESFKEEAVRGVLEKSMPEIVEQELSGHPGAFQKLMQDGVYYESEEPQYGSTREPDHSLRTRTGKIEFVSEHLKEFGLFGLPEYCEIQNLPGEEEYRFLVGRVAWHTHARTQNNAYLWEIMKENSIWINTKEAKRLGVETGDYVKVSSNAGSQTVRVLATEKIRPDCVFYTHGWNSHSQQMSRIYNTGASQAEILEDHLESVTGSSCMHETMVRIEKV